MDQSLQAPFLAYFEPTHQVLLVQFRGNFTVESTQALNRTARAVVERHGNVIAITEFAMDLRDWKELGHNRRAIRDRRRVLVAPDPQVRAMLTLHGTHQSPSHRDDTSVVRTLEEAFRQLGIKAPKFEPLPL